MGHPGTDPIKAAQAMALGDVGYNTRQIAADIGIPQSTVRDIVKKHGRWGEIADKPVFAKLRSEQSQILEAAYRAGSAELFARAFDPAKLEKASTYQLVMSSAIAIDKARLLAGEATQHVAHAHVHEVKGLDALAARLGQALLPAGDVATKDSGDPAPMAEVKESE